MMSRKEFFGIAVLAALSLGGFLLASYFTYRIGFPLDDAWIHQTYARNLAAGEWAFVPGQPSAGSTAPLWSALLAVGDLLGLGPYVWTYFLGWLGLVGLGVLGYVAVGVFAPVRKQARIWGAVVLVLEWHLVWAAGSGMETLLFAGMVTLILVWLAADWGQWFWLGALIGFCVWVRPDGVTLLAPAGVVILGAREPWGIRFRAGVRIGLGFALFFLPYLGFNQFLAGAWWPNTFFAKQAEYVALHELFLGTRFFAQLSLPLVGVGVVLLPGVGWLGGQAWKARRWAVLAGMVWWVGYAGLYAWRLPVTYQHGRYFMPAMPIFFLWGGAGLGQVRLMSRDLLRRVGGRGWVLTTGLVLSVFWFWGAQAYARDVAFIESEMVTTAHWVAEHTEADALVAAHDIGALGYFGKRHILDLAGLISPEVIPFIRDEGQLANYLDMSGAEYLITLQAWYPELESQLPVIFQTDGRFTQAEGGTGMTVYLWRRDK